MPDSQRSQVGHSTEREREVLQFLGGHLKNGYSRHLGGPWYVARSPDRGKLSFTRDHGTGTHPVPMSEVPAKILARHGVDAVIQKDRPDA